MFTPYHDRVLTTPSELRNALAYVLNNARRHARTWLLRHGWRRAGPIRVDEVPGRRRRR